jgi:hypothetical protein
MKNNEIVHVNRSNGIIVVAVQSWIGVKGKGEKYINHFSYDVVSKSSITNYNDRSDAIMKANNPHYGEWSAPCPLNYYY